MRTRRRRHKSVRPRGTLSLGIRGPNMFMWTYRYQRPHKNPTHPPSLWPTRVAVDPLPPVSCGYNYQVSYLLCWQQVFQRRQQKHIFEALSGLFLLSLNLYQQGYTILAPNI